MKDEVCQCLRFCGLRVASVSPLRVYVVLGLMWHSDDGHGFSDILANVCQNRSQSIISCPGSLCFEKEVQQAVSMQLPHGPTALSCPASPTFLQRL